MDTQQAITEILAALPAEWEGTTFKNNELLGRAGFARNLAALLDRKASSGATPISTAELEALGNAEDYLRVATNVSATLEFFLARQHSLPIDQVFTFASSAMPIIAALLSSSLPVVLFTGAQPAPLLDPKLLQLFNAHLSIHSGLPSAHPHATVLYSGCVALPLDLASHVDATVCDSVLYIHNTDKIAPSEVLVVRKRMSTPMTTPAALTTLRQLAALPAAEIAPPNLTELAEFHSHLQTLSGTDHNPDSTPVVFTAGLPSIASLWFTLVAQGGAEIVMASTAYGGSSQLCDLLSARSSLLRKHTFDVQGLHTDIVARIAQKLDSLVEESSEFRPLLPTTVLFSEIPTNPDMKVPDTRELARVLRRFAERSGKRVLLLVDTTFAPGSHVMRKFFETAPDLPVMAFVSLSKSVSRGITTAGALVANHTETATALLRSVAHTAEMLDTTAKADQLRRLVDNHANVEARCLRAYQVAAEVGAELQRAVKRYANVEMALAFVTPEQAAAGFSSSTFSFNLPVIPGGSDAENAALAQRFVDLLCTHEEFKPCVSFGQDNGLVYATVPATSTQGAIKEEDKAKQAVGGVQLVRLSFAPSVDVDAVSRIVDRATATVYARV